MDPVQHLSTNILIRTKSSNPDKLFSDQNMEIFWSENSFWTPNNLLWSKHHPSHFSEDPRNSLWLFRKLSGVFHRVSFSRRILGTFCFTANITCTQLFVNDHKPSQWQVLCGRYLSKLSLLSMNSAFVHSYDWFHGKALTSPDFMFSWLVSFDTLPSTRDFQRLSPPLVSLLNQSVFRIGRLMKPKRKQLKRPHL